MYWHEFWCPYDTFGNGLSQLENKCWGKGHSRKEPRIINKINKPRRKAKK